MPYPNLKAEIARLDLKTKTIAEGIGESETWVNSRLYGKCEFPFSKAMMIRDKFFKQCSLEYLFSYEL